MAATLRDSTNRLAGDLDRNLGSAFRGLLKASPDGTGKDRAIKNFRAVRERVVDEALGKLLDTVFKGFAAPSGARRVPETDQAVADVTMLRDRGFVETSAELFRAWREAFTRLPLEQALVVAPDARSFEAWVKGTKVSARELQARLMEKPVDAYTTPAADWLLERGKVEQLLPLLELFLNRRQRQSYLPPWNVALSQALKKDKRGVLLSAALRQPWPDAACVVALGEAVRANRRSVRIAVDVLPEIVGEKEGVPNTVAFVEEVFGSIAATLEREREFATAALARLATGLLLSDRRGEQTTALLGLIQKYSRQLRNLTRDESMKSQTWLLENLCAEEKVEGGRVLISREAARHFAVAFEQAAQGFSAKDVLGVTARNLGLSSIGKKGENVSYDPLQHDDVEGGLIPGDSAEIEEGGWAIQGDALVRAKVRRAKGG